MAEATYLSIGEVLGILLEEFPDVTISKIRFLESQGLIEPERTPSGYRKFYDTDVDLLRAILREQKDNFLPLKVIRNRIESGEIEADVTGSITLPRGIRNVDITKGTARLVALVQDDVKPVHAASAVVQSAAVAAEPSAPVARVPADSVFRRTDVAEVSAIASATTPTKPEPRPEPATSSAPGHPAHPALGEPSAAEQPEVAPSVISDRVVEDRSAKAPASRSSSQSSGPLSADELCVAANITAAQLVELEQYGVVGPRGTGANPTYSGDAVHLARVSGLLMAQGVDARHLRSWKVSAEREATLFEQLVTPLLRQRNPQSRRRAHETLTELAALGNDLRGAFMTSLLRSYDDAN